MLRRILLTLLVLVGLFVIGIGIIAAIASTRPDDFSVTRSATMAAPPALVFEQVNDFRKWETWSPWAKLDPNSHITFSGPASGAGSTFAWSGNNEVGEGRQTIVESRPAERIRIELEFIKPFPGTSDVEFTFQPEGSGTLVTWTMTGKNNIVSKAMSLFMDCDKMIGGFFEQGLANMKSLVESTPSA